MIKIWSLNLQAWSCHPQHVYEFTFSLRLFEVFAEVLIVLYRKGKNVSYQDAKEGSIDAGP